ncbi:hypothetical protein SCHPADRAFT_901477 [Schizopora paradoxa]|uniref:Uncharacterized protein n=1 Tax=Schizopora paradoxa TaxID=27342 RepID=A0A0H2RXN8_9AGAM|nr:hypothetical protein SCHPADRAFT_901477 [Schizopora paradoxa]
MHGKGRQDARCRQSCKHRLRHAPLPLQMSIFVTNYSSNENVSLAHSAAILVLQLFEDVPLLSGSKFVGRRSLARRERRLISGSHRFEIASTRREQAHELEDHASIRHSGKRSPSLRERSRTYVNVPDDAVASEARRLHFDSRNTSSFRRDSIMYEVSVFQYRAKASASDAYPESKLGCCSPITTGVAPESTFGAACIS